MQSKKRILSLSVIKASERRVHVLTFYLFSTQWRRTSLLLREDLNEGYRLDCGEKQIFFNELYR